MVRGQRSSLFSALNQKRASDSFIDVLSADAIGQFPDSFDVILVEEASVN